MSAGGVCDAAECLQGPDSTRREPGTWDALLKGPG